LYQNNQWQLDRFTSNRFTSKNQEKGCARFLNVVSCLSAQKANLQMLKRSWASHHNHKLAGIRATRMPDIVLFDNVSNNTSLPTPMILRHVFDNELRTDDSHSFNTLRATCQVKSNPTNTKGAQNNLTQDAYFMFSYQANQRFFLGLSFCATKMSLSLFDHAGALHSETFDIDNKPLKLIRLCLGLTLCDESVIGYDPTIEFKSEPKFIHVENQRFEILSTELITDVI
jgi:hypothetical protein